MNETCNNIKRKTTICKLNPQAKQDNKQKTTATKQQKLYNIKSNLLESYLLHHFATTLMKMANGNN